MNNLERIKQANLKYVIPVAAGAGAGGAVGAAKSHKDERLSGALQGAGVGAMLGGAGGALHAIAEGVRKTRQSPKASRTVGKHIDKLKEEIRGLKDDAHKRHKAEMDWAKAQIKKAKNRK